VIVTVNGVASAANPADRFTYTAATLQTVPVAVPTLAKGTGFWFTLTSNDAGTVGSTWATSGRIQGTLAIYAGNPFAALTNPVKLSPPAGALTLDKGNKASYAAAVVGQPAGVYTIYFFSGSATGASAGTATYMKQ